MDVVMLDQRIQAKEHMLYDFIYTKSETNMTELQCWKSEGGWGNSHPEGAPSTLPNSGDVLFIYLDGVFMDFTLC